MRCYLALNRTFDVLLEGADEEEAFLFGEDSDHNQILVGLD